MHDAEADEFEETGVDDLAFVERPRTVIELDLVSGVGVALCGDAEVIVTVAVFAVSRRGPAFYVACPIVGGGEPDQGRRFVAVLFGDVGRSDEPCDLGGDR